MNTPNLDVGKGQILPEDVFSNENLLTSLRPGKVPPIVSWLLTDLCNMRCSHCYPESSPEKNKSALSENQHYKIVEILAKSGVKSVILSGGEPMLIPYLQNLIRKLTSCNIAVSMCTNGSLITPIVAKKLKEEGLKRVSISIDGTEENIHDGLRLHPGAYKKAVQAIKIFSDCGLAVFVDYTATKINSKKIGTLSRKVKEMGALGLKIKRFIPIGRGKKNSDKLLLSLTEMQSLLDEFFPFDVSFCNLHDPAAYSYYRVRHNFNNFTSRSISQRQGCVAALGWFAIQTNGNITPCPLLNISLGKILDYSDIGSIFCNSSIISSILNRDIRDGACGICKERNLCGGCRAHAYAISGNYLAEDPLCIIAKDAVHDQIT